MSPGGPQRGEGDNALCGVYYALCTRNDDPDGPGGRIRVRFPWMPEGQRDESHWAQLCVPMIGGSYGTYTVPEIDDTVLVVFIHGDIRQPVVIGGVWNQVDPPPETNSAGGNDFRLIKSRSGHRVILDDSDTVKVVFTDPTNRNLMTVGAFGGGGQGPNRFEAPLPGAVHGSAADGGVDVAAYEGGAKVNVFCPAGELSIRADNVELTASETVDLKGGTSLEIEAPSTEVGSGSASNYEGGTIKIG